MSPYNDVVCFSHLRWNFVYQRPQHILSRCARDRRVFFVEEPIYGGDRSRLEITQGGDRIWIVVPHLARGTSPPGAEHEQASLLTKLITDYQIASYVLWYYTPMAISFSRNLEPRAIVYDCMDELAAFDGAPNAMRERERELFRRADVVFTGGHSLYEAKRLHHPNVHPIPSSVDVAHFAKALTNRGDPDDQAGIPHPRLGFMGVIDERMDRELLARIATMRPDWHFVLLGPVVKIDPASLPHGPNLHYLGGKLYDQLPSYLGGWDVALMPFALNDSTRYISPTKTPEYLAAGRPVVSTPIEDVVSPYGVNGMVRIARTPREFVAACDAALREDSQVRQQEARTFLKEMSWDRTWVRMSELIDQAVYARSELRVRGACPTRESECSIF